MYFSKREKVPPIYPFRSLPLSTSFPPGRKKRPKKSACTFPRSLARLPAAHSPNPPAPRTRAVMPGNPISCISARKRLGGPMQINLARSQRPSSSRLSGRPLERARARTRALLLLRRPPLSPSRVSRFPHSSHFVFLHRQKIRGGDSNFSRYIAPASASGDHSIPRHKQEDFAARRRSYGSR